MCNIEHTNKLADISAWMMRYQSATLLITLAVMVKLHAFLESQPRKAEIPAAAEDHQDHAADAAEIESQLQQRAHVDSLMQQRSKVLSDIEKVKAALQREHEQAQQSSISVDFAPISTSHDKESLVTQQQQMHQYLAGLDSQLTPFMQ